MESRLQRSAAALGRLVSHHAIHLGAFVVVLLVLFGWVSGEHLPLLLALIVAGRSALIGAEGMRKRWTEGDWRALHEHLVAELRALDPEDLASETADSELDPGTHPEALARAFVEERRRRHVEPRPGRELIAEWMGLLTFCLFLPIGFVLFTHDIVSSRRGYGFAEIGVTILCLAVYAWPHRWASVDGVGDRRSMWWALPLVPALALVYTGVTIHHPYLDPRREDRGKLAAERVLALDSNVVAGAHADWVFAYAAELASHGEVEPAIALYRRGLHLAPRAGDARRQLAALERPLDPRAEVASEGGDPRPRAHGLSADQFARLPLWDSRRSPHPVPSCRIDASLESVPRTTVVLVSLGSVPPGLIEAVGDVLHEELGLPVCRVEEPVPLPDADRVRGVVFGRQWNDAALVQHFRERSQPLPEAPLKYLLLTGADIYSEGSNFVFSSSRTFGVVLSYARYGDPGADWETVRYRTAKQALGALIKSFDLPPASDPNCVTSYSNGVPQFDAKGNRPTAATFLKFLERVEEQDTRWRAHLAARARLG